MFKFQGFIIFRFTERSSNFHPEKSFQTVMITATKMLTMSIIAQLQPRRLQLPRLQLQQLLPPQLQQQLQPQQQQQLPTNSWTGVVVIWSLSVWG